jgi:hypothetical protein
MDLLPLHLGLTVEGVGAKPDGSNHHQRDKQIAYGSATGLGLGNSFSVPLDPIPGIKPPMLPRCVLGINAQSNRPTKAAIRGVEQWKPWGNALGMICGLFLRCSHWGRSSRFCG